MVRKTWFVAMAVLMLPACEDGPTHPHPQSEVASVEVTPGEASLIVGDARVFVATVRGTDGTVLNGKTVVWNSTNSGIAEVTSAGHVTARGSGAAKISAAVNGKRGEAQVQVAVPTVVSVELDVASVVLEEGDHRQLVATPIDQRGLPVSGLGIQWTSDGPEIATVDALGEIAAVRAGSTTITATIHGKQASVQVSVEANYPYDLLYTMPSSEHGLAEIFRIDMHQSGATATRQFPASTWASSPRPSPDGTLIAFVCWGAFGEHAICVADRDGSNSRTVSWAMGEQHTSPTWSPDGTRLAIVRTISEPGNALARSRIAVVRIDDSSLVTLTGDMEGDQMTPAWSPRLVDGTERVAFSSGTGAERRLWTMRPDGSGARHITAVSGALDRQPAWSPDGATIVFQRFGLHSNGELRLVGGDGTGERALGPALPGIQASPVWSPDGRLIAFTSAHESYGTGAPSYQLYTIWADGTKLARRSFDAGDKGSPAWLPRP